MTESNPSQEAPKEGRRGLFRRKAPVSGTSALQPEIQEHNLTTVDKPAVIGGRNPIISPADPLKPASTKVGPLENPYSTSVDSDADASSGTPHKTSASQEQAIDHTEEKPKRVISRRKFLGMAAVTTAGAAEVALDAQGKGIISVFKGLFSKNGGSEKKQAVVVTQKTPAKTPTVPPTPTEIPLTERLPFKIYNEVPIGNFFVGISEDVHSAVPCETKPGTTVTCMGLEGLYLDKNLDPNGEKAKHFDETVKYLAWKDRNPDTTLTFDQFVAKLSDPNANLSVSFRGFEGASSLPKEGLSVDLKKPIHYIQTAFSKGGLYKLGDTWRGSLILYNNELYLTFADFSQGSLSPEFQKPNLGLYPKNYDISNSMANISAIFIDSGSQTASDILGERRPQMVKNTNQLKQDLWTNMTHPDGIINALPAK